MKPSVQFFKYWRDLVDKGTVSGLDRTERMSIDIFEDWLLEHFSLQPKPEPSETTPAIREAVAEAKTEWDRQQSEAVMNLIESQKAVLRRAVAERTEEAALVAESMAVRYLPMQAGLYKAVDAVALAIRSLEKP